MRNIQIRWIANNAAMIISLLAACDPFTEDNVPRPTINSYVSNYYILPNTSVVIDLKALVNSSFTNATLRVSENPTRGDLTFLDEFLLKYDPRSSFMDGKDQFQISISNNGVMLKTELLTVHMSNDTTDFPCSLFAVEDYAFTKPDSSIALEFLLNDRICGVDKSDVQTSIYSQPKNGQAKLVDDVIIYSPNQGYLGSDSMVYKIIAGGNHKATGNTKNVSYGIISLHVSAMTCNSTLLTSYVLDLTDDVNDPSNSGDCAGGYDLSNIWNDKPCPIGTEVSISLITQTSNSGEVCMGADGGFAYFPDPQATPKNDTAQYEICINGNCNDVLLYIKREVLPTRIEWSRQLFQVSGYLSTIFFVNEDTGYVGGDQGIFKTSDGGINWNKLASSPPIDGMYSSINKLYFIDANQGFAGYGGCNNQMEDCKGGLMKTTDGGATWSIIELDDAVTSVFFNSPTTGFITTASILFDLDYLSMNKIYKTTDGGLNWKFVSYGGRNDICFVNSSIGYASDFGGIIKTMDAGETWQEAITLNPFMNVTSLAMSTNFIFATFSSGPDVGDIWRSEDGINWDRKAEGNSWNNSIAFSPSGDLGVVVGYNHKQLTNTTFYSIPAVYLSYDSGKTWMKESFDETYYDMGFLDVAVPSNKVAYMVGGLNKVLKYRRN